MIKDKSKIEKLTADNERLKDENKRLNFILDHIGACVYTNDIDGRYTYANHQTCQLFGYPAEDVIGETDEKFFDLNACDELRQNDLIVLQTGKRIESEEKSIIEGADEERTYWSVKLPIYDENGVITALCGISSDITENVQIRKEIEEKEALLSLVLENIPSCVYVKDTQGRYQYINSNAASLLGHNAEDIVGKSDKEISLSYISDETIRLDFEVLRTGQKIISEESATSTSGEKVHFWVARAPFKVNNKVSGLINIFTDISEVVSLKNKFFEQARTDQLTGVLSRRFLLDLAEAHLKQTRHSVSQMAVMLIDIDYFKGVNDTYGHVFGDLFLQASAKAMSLVLRECDLLGRIGGDEFVIVLNNITEEGIEIVAERLQEVMSKTYLKASDGKSIRVSVSVGISLSSPDCTLDSMIEKADIALYQAKMDGRGCWRLAT